MPAKMRQMAACSSAVMPSVPMAARSWAKAAEAFCFSSGCRQEEMGEETSLPRPEHPGRRHRDTHRGRQQGLWKPYGRQGEGNKRLQEQFGQQQEKPPAGSPRAWYQEQAWVHPAVHHHAIPTSAASRERLSSSWRSMFYIFSLNAPTHRHAGAS